MSASPSLFLASASARRQALLTDWGYKFTCIPNRLLEEKLPTTGTLRSIQAAVKQLAFQKAKCSAVHHKGIILAADTLILFQRQVLGKPKDLLEAKQMLRRFSAQRHRVLTGVALYDTLSRRRFLFCVSTWVQFRDLSEMMISSYCDQYPVLDKAGAYGIQDIGSQFVEFYEGSYENVVGLPRYPLAQYLSFLGLKGN